MIFEQSLNRKSSIRTSNLRLFFLMILLTSPIATFANDIAEGKNVEINENCNKFINGLK